MNFQQKKIQCLGLIFGFWIFPILLSAQTNIETKLTHNNCPEDKNGMIHLKINQVVVDQYSLPYSGEWENITTGDYGQFEINSLDYSIADLESGDYEITIFLDDNCEIGLDEKIIDENGIDIDGSVDCRTINLNVSSSSSVGIYLFEWSNGIKIENFAPVSLENLTRGIYCVTVTSIFSQTCVAEDCFEVLDIPELVITSNITPSYKNCNTGSIDITVTGGFEPYTYVWSNRGSATTEDVGNLYPGSYTVTVTDDLCGELVASFEVPAKGDYLPVLTKVVQPECNSLGSIKVTPKIEQNPAGCEPTSFTILWSTDETTESIENLAEGDYSVTITPHYSGLACQSGCVVVKNFKLEISDLISEITVENICLEGDNTGSLTANVTDAAYYPITYMWSTGKPLKTITNLESGSYTVTITDAHQCTETATAEIESQFVLDEKIESPSGGCSKSNGSIHLIPNGTLDNCPLYFSYSWDYMGKKTSSLENLAAGTYKVTITTTPGTFTCGDLQGCSVERTYTLTDENEMQATIVSYNNFEDCEFDEGQLVENPIGGNIDVNVTGGKEPYSYVWMFNGDVIASTQDINGELTGTGPGNYSLAVTDAKGCTSELDVDLCCCTYEQFSEVPNKELPFLCSSAGGEIGSTGPALFYIDKVLKSPTTSTSNDGEIKLIIKWKNIGENTPNLKYYWTDENGKFISNERFILGLDPGVYHVLVTSGCTERRATFTLVDCEKVSSNMQIVGVVSNKPCLGYDVGSIDIQHVTGGTSPYTYRWSHGPTTEDIDGLELGSYDVTVTDDSGCGSTANFTIDEMNELTRKRCQVFCGGNVVESFLPKTKDYNISNCLYGQYVCSDGGWGGAFVDKASYAYYETDTECGVKFTCPGLDEDHGGLLKIVKGTLVDDLDFSGEKLVFTQTLKGSISGSSLELPNLIQKIANPELKPFCGEFEGCKFVSIFGADIYYQKSYTLQQDYYDVIQQVSVKNGWQKISDVEICDYCPETDTGYGPKSRCCMVFKCKGQVLKKGECQSCGYAQPVLDEFFLESQIDTYSKSDFIQNTEIEFTIIPNPTATDKVIIRFESNTLGNVSIGVFDLLESKPLISRTYDIDSHTIELSLPFSSGVYFVVIKDNKGNRAIKKLVKL